MPKAKKKRSLHLPPKIDFPPEMTNHDRMIWRKDRRDRERAQAKPIDESGIIVE